MGIHMVVSQYFPKIHMMYHGFVFSLNQTNLYKLRTDKGLEGDIQPKKKELEGTEENSLTLWPKKVSFLKIVSLLTWSANPKSVNPSSPPVILSVKQKLQLFISMRVC
jgi:hypothetical protein